VFFGLAGSETCWCAGKHICSVRETLAKTWSRVGFVDTFVIECLLPFNVYIFFVLFLLQIPHPDPVYGHMDAVGLGRENTNEWALSWLGIGGVKWVERKLC